jgi:hypothetical protein
MANTQKQIRTLESIVKKLRQAQAQAASIEFTLGNGALLDSLLGSTADEIDTIISLNKRLEN